MKRRWRASSSSLLAFKTLDANARIYGQILYSSLLNLGEVIGVDAYVKVSIGSHKKVQQRVRDFLYYRCFASRRSSASKPRRKQPNVSDLFPKAFSGHDDPVFCEQTNQSLEPPLAVQMSSFR